MGCGYDCTPFLYESKFLLLKYFKETTKMKKAKNLTPMQIHSAIREALLNNHEFEAKVVEYDFCKYIRKVTDNETKPIGYFTVTITTTCEGSVIGTFMISYTTANDEYDVHSGFICMNDKPEWIINEILRHTDPACVEDYESVEPICPNCGSKLISDNYLHTDECGNYCNAEFVCGECGCEFDAPEKKEVK
jgi:hypothetical protein